jgi:hypothetical protein
MICPQVMYEMLRINHRRPRALVRLRESICNW